MTNTGYGSVSVLLWVFGQQLMGHQTAVGALGHDVGEGTASVNPELPFIRGGDWVHTQILTLAQHFKNATTSSL
jgi:hypothetical protein